MNDNIKKIIYDIDYFLMNNRYNKMIFKKKIEFAEIKIMKEFPRRDNFCTLKFKTNAW